MRKKFFQSGEISTILTIGMLLFLGVTALSSSLILKNKTSTSPRAANTLRCQDNPETPPSGYYWKADCSKPCHDKSACQQNTTDPSNVNPGTSSWCYGFVGSTGTWDDWRCMMLLKNGDPRIGTPNTGSGNPQPTSTTVSVQPTATPTSRGGGEPTAIPTQRRDEPTAVPTQRGGPTAIPTQRNDASTATPIPGESTATPTSAPTPTSTTQPTTPTLIATLTPTSAPTLANQCEPGFKECAGDATRKGFNNCEFNQNINIYNKVFHECGNQEVCKEERIQAGESNPCGPESIKPPLTLAGTCIDYGSQGNSAPAPNTSCPRFTTETCFEISVLGGYTSQGIRYVKKGCKENGDSCSYYCKTFDDMKIDLSNNIGNLDPNGTFSGSCTDNGGTCFSDGKYSVTIKIQVDTDLEKDWLSQGYKIKNFVLEKNANGNKGIVTFQNYPNGRYNGSTNIREVIEYRTWTYPNKLVKFNTWVYLEKDGRLYGFTAESLNYNTMQLVGGSVILLQIVDNTKQ